MVKYDCQQNAKWSDAMNSRDYLQREAEGVCMRNRRDDEWEYKQQEYLERKMWRNLSCADGFCGADDCATCRPGSYRFSQSEDGED